MKVFLMTTIFLLSSAFSFADSGNTNSMRGQDPTDRFPLPKGFTILLSQASKHKLHVNFSPSTLAKLTNTSYIANAIGATLCKNLKKQQIETTINGVSYTLVPYTSSGSLQRNGQYSGLCVFGWIKTQNIAYSWGSKYIETDSPKYYPLF
ncbi:MAG: hypothetical protein OXJ52_05200 [Oligoflexia bacterium]|nr:hypothetical protein [Oligoflexia bacterium]